MKDVVQIDTDVERRIATIRIDRPPRNAVSRELWTKFAQAASQLARRDDIRAVVVWGGRQIFSAGGDIKEFANYGYQEVAALAPLQQRSLDLLARMPQITVAAINGHALGGGCEIALACDFRVTAEDAKLGLPEVRLGIMPGSGGTQRLPRLIGAARAKELIFSGRAVGAREAETIGLVTRVVKPDEVYDAAFELATQYASGPYSLRLVKQAIDEGLETSLDQGLRLESALLAQCFATQDARIGIRAFLSQEDEGGFLGR